jgi:hypothetical protein
VLSIAFPSSSSRRATLLGLVLAATLAPASRAAASRPCDLSAHRPTAGLAARQTEDGGLTLAWAGAAGHDLRLRLARPDGVPTITELALRRRGGPWVVALRQARPEFRVATGLRRITQQQLRPLGRLGVPITKEVIDREKWNAFWDAPLFIEGSALKPPSHETSIPVEQASELHPGLPRKPEEVRRATATYVDEGCTVRTEGARLEVHLPGVRLGVFTGALVLTVYRGSNLIRLAVVARTDEPSVAYKYDAGLTGLPLEPGTRAARAGIVYRDLAGNLQRLTLRGPTNDQPVTLKSMNRLVVAETGGASVAAFPPPHSFYWARETEEVLGYAWFRKDGPASFSFGIRQAEHEEDPEYLQNFALYSARPGTWQRMPLFLHVGLEDGRGALEAARAFTRGDRFKALPGYKVMGAHYHAGFAARLRKAGGPDAFRPDLDAIKATGIDIFAPIDGAREAPPTPEARLAALAEYYEAARRHSDDELLVMPNEEFGAHLGGHSDLILSRPVYWLFQRKPGQPLVEEHPKYGRVYNVGSAADVMQMAERENALVFIPHPRSKGSTGYPDALKDSAHFRHPRYRGAGYRWGMGIDGSETRLCELRCLALFDDMNNWVAELPDPKYMQAIAETRSDIGHRGRQPYDDVYGMSPVNYVRLAALPSGDDYSPIVNALARGDFFVTSGEVLIPSFAVQGTGETRTVVAEVEWTFPLDFVEVITGDGRHVNRQVISASSEAAFGRRRFTVPFPANGQKWVRFAAWDVAGNGAFVQPVRLGKPGAP